MRNLDTIVILAAAGQSNRFRNSSEKFALHNKVFLPLKGREVWQHSVSQFRKTKRVGRIYMTISANDRDFIASQHARYLQELDVQLVTGGNERWVSILNAMNRINEDYPELAAEHLVAIHDAARPCVSLASIEAVLNMASQHGAAILGQPLWGTIKRVDQNQRIVETVPRDNLFQATTPQVCRWQWLRRAYSAANLELAAMQGVITDDAQLITTAGYTVQLCRDLSSNIKITTADDLPLAEQLLETGDTH